MARIVGCNKTTWVCKHLKNPFGQSRIVNLTSPVLGLFAVVGVLAVLTISLVDGSSRPVVSLGCSNVVI